MAFELLELNLWDEFVTEDPDSGADSARIKTWMYASADALATINGGTYFAAAGSTSGNSTLNKNDWIFVVGSDGSEVLKVTDAAAGATAVVVSQGVGAAADIAALTENSGAIGGSSDKDLPNLTATAAVVTDSTGGTANGTMLPGVSSSGIHVWADGAGVTETITATGAVAGDVCFAEMETAAGATVIIKAVATTDVITITTDVNGADGDRISFVSFTPGASAINKNFADLAAEVNKLVADVADNIAGLRELATQQNLLRTNMRTAGIML